MAYILNFLFNLMFFSCLQKCRSDWSYCLSKILKNNQIIKYIWFYNNNSDINNNKNNKMAFAIFATDLAILKNFQPY